MDTSEWHFRTTPWIVQSLNSPFFPPHIGAEPGQAKEESRITCMRMLKTPPFFPPKSGEKPYLEVFSRFGLWRDFLNDNIQATISAYRLIKNMSIDHLRITSCLFFKASLGAHLFICKSIFIHMKMSLICL